jgi:Tfp pilus assembly protein PilZ
MDLTARCETSDNIFKERVYDLSAGGVFLTTRRQFSIGQEIAVTIPLPDSQLAIRATGEIVRINDLGVGVEFKVIFNH